MKIDVWSKTLTLFCRNSTSFLPLICSRKCWQMLRNSIRKLYNIYILSVLFFIFKIQGKIPQLNVDSLVMLSDSSESEAENLEVKTKRGGGQFFSQKILKIYHNFQELELGFGFSEIFKRS